MRRNYIRIWRFEFYRSDKWFGKLRGAVYGGGCKCRFFTFFGIGIIYLKGHCYKYEH